MKLSFIVLITVFLLTSCSGSKKITSPRADPRMGSVTAEDFFFYSCVRQYMEINSIKVFDSSVAYAVEYSTVSSNDLGRIYESAKKFAKTISKPDYRDREHGLPAVLVLCQKESRKEKTDNR